VESLYPVLVAAIPVVLPVLIVAILTYFDLDTVFDPPANLSWGPWFRLQVAWWGFVLANAGLAGGLYFILSEISYFQETNSWLKATYVGFGYPALVRLKFTTLPINGQATPIGIDTFYEGLKNLVHKRINRIIREWRMEKTGSLAQLPLGALRQQSETLVLSDALMSDEQRKSANAWIEQTVTAEGIGDDYRRLLLAIFILTGQMRRKS
jgi:hypothetical protein